MKKLKRWLMPSVAWAHHQPGIVFLHSNRFVLVDRQADIRGYYNSNEAQDMETLKQHVRLLLKQ